MCKHRYQDYESFPKDRQYCYLNKYIDSPLDKEGFCIFHSTDVQWKQENNFVEWLDTLKDILVLEREYVNFSEFHFVASQEKRSIDYLNLLSNADLRNSTFHHIIICENIRVKGTLDFKHCNFHPVLRFSNCIFENEFKFSEIDVTDNIQLPLMVFRDCKFYNILDYGNNYKVNMNFSFIRCMFNSLQMRDFSNLEEFGAFNFTQCEAIVFDLQDCIINNPDFTETKFHLAEINNVAFRGEAVFDDIKVKSNLKFLGGKDYSIFEGITRFDVDFKEIQGNIYFENANISSFLKSHKDALLDFEKRENGKVVIGSGCIKYRTLSDDKVYKIKDFHHHFITEIGHSFSNFFTQYNGFNLGIEVRSKTKKDITIFYFTDDDIDKPEFNKLINSTSARIFGVESQVTKESSIQEEAVINYQIDLIRSLTKIAYQIQKNNWNFDDSNAFFSALNLSPNIYLDQKSTHAFLKNINVNDFLQTVHNLSITINQQGNENKFVGVVNADKMINKKKKKEL